MELCDLRAAPQQIIGSQVGDGFGNGQFAIVTCGDLDDPGLALVVEHALAVGAVIEVGGVHGDGFQVGAAAEGTAGNIRKSGGNVDLHQAAFGKGGVAQVGQAGGELDALDAPAALKGGIPDGPDTFRDHQWRTGQALAACKRKVADLPKTAGQVDGPQVDAAFKGAFADDRQGVGELDGLQSVHAVEIVGTDGGNAGGDDDGVDGKVGPGGTGAGEIAILVPVHSGLGHIAGTGDGQNTGRILPGDVLPGIDLAGEDLDGQQAEDQHRSQQKGHDSLFHNSSSFVLDSIILYHLPTRPSTTRTPDQGG